MPQNPYNAPVGLNYAHISTATTTVVKSAPGLLGSIVVNSVAAATGTISVFDNTSAAAPTVAVLALSTTPPLAGAEYTFNVNLKNGLTIVTSEVIDITVIYR